MYDPSIAFITYLAFNSMNSLFFVFIIIVSNLSVRCIFSGRTTCNNKFTFQKTYYFYFSYQLLLYDVTKELKNEKYASSKTFSFDTQLQATQLSNLFGLNGSASDNEFALINNESTQIYVNKYNK